MKENHSTQDILTWILSRSADINAIDLPTLADWKLLFDAETSNWKVTADRAVIGGFLADRVAYALAAGYESALRRLVPSLPERAIVSFCITEEKGGHPASIKSTLQKTEEKAGSDWILDGNKKFITMPEEADLLLVAASTGLNSDGKNKLRIVKVDRRTSGITITRMPNLPFVPEISHGTATFSRVPVKEEFILPGDGYIGYIKPFRTIEDLHIFAAIAGFIFRIACRFRWPRSVHEQIAGVIVCIRALTLDDPSSPAIHIAVGGLHAQIISMLDTISPHWELVDEKTRSGWERDRALIRVAEKARAKRLETAWSKFG